MKVLCIQFRQMGDILMTTPALRLLKSVRPDAEIHFLANRGPASVLSNNPHVDRLIAADAHGFFALMTALRGARYDAAVDFMGTPRSARWAFLSGARLRVGFSKPWRNIFYNRSLPLPAGPLYSASEKLLLLHPLLPDKFLPSPAYSPLPEIFPGPDDDVFARNLLDRFDLGDRKKPVAFAPVSRRTYKRWPPARYAEVCDSLHRHYRLTFLPLFGPGEEDQVEAVIRASSFPGIFHFPYAPGSFAAVRRIMEGCLFYFGNDNGIRHLAVMAGLPTASVFGIPNPACWTPDLPGRHQTLWGHDRIADITTDQVTRMVEAIIHENHLV